MSSNIWNVMFREASSAKIVEALQIELDATKKEIESGQQYRDLENVVVKYDRLLREARLSLDKIAHHLEGPHSRDAMVAEALRGLEKSYWFEDK